jgi:hypothetical protein
MRRPAILCHDYGGLQRTRTAATATDWHSTRYGTARPTPERKLVQMIRWTVDLLLLMRSFNSLPSSNRPKR